MMNDRTELRLLDIMPSPRSGTRIVQVEILRGEPKAGMELRCPESPGRWRITGFGTSACESSVGSQPSMNLALLGLEEEGELGLGFRLVEAR